MRCILIWGLKSNVTRENWHSEIESAFLYRSLSKAENQPALAEVYRLLFSGLALFMIGAGITFGIGRLIGVNIAV